MAETPAEERVHLETDAKSHIARITIDNQARRNTYDPSMRRRFGELLDEVADLDATSLDRHERPVAAVLHAPARAADRRGGVAAAGAERALAVPEQPPHALLGPPLARD